VGMIKTVQQLYNLSIKLLDYLTIKTYEYKTSLNSDEFPTVFRVGCVDDDFGALWFR